MKKQLEKKCRVGVLMGGCSSEREISLKSGKAVYQSLLTQGYDAVSIDLNEMEIRKINETILKAKIDVAFIALHGQWGEDGRIQFLLEDLNIPYTGSGPQASQKALHKVKAQKIFETNGITIAKYVSLLRGDEADKNAVIDNWNIFPCIVKPSAEGSSFGIKLVFSKEELGPAVDFAFEFDENVLIEKYIKGRELTVGILDGRPLPIIEICPQGSFFDFQCKYRKGMTDYKVPAELDLALSRTIQETAVRAHHLLGCRHFSRVDFMLAENNQHFVLEVNTIPGFTETSLLPKAAKVAGLNFDQLISRILVLAYGSKEEVKNSAVTI
ncbi:MAG: D-alanine--D-alanine ligase [Candidatus Omnitrophica bacterium]|nr:D-alanine--D-alanine ligase [Candidatus Omnitrophota bacterium]